MKRKLLTILSLLLFLIYGSVVYADESCNKYYKININIEGNGTIRIKDSEKSFTKDGSINVKCNDSLFIGVIPDEGYFIKGVYSDGNYLTRVDSYYEINNISSNINLKVILSLEEKDLDNELVYSSNESNISLYIDSRDEYRDDSVFKFKLKEITIIFDNEFVKKCADNITLVANEIYKNDLNIKEQKAAKDSLYYDINLYSGKTLIEKIDGKATVLIPYNNSDKVYVYRMLKNGKLSKIDSEYKDGIVSFKVNEFGKFALSKVELSELNYVKNIINLNNKQKIAIISVGLALALLIVFIKVKKRR